MYLSRMESLSHSLLVTSKLEPIRHSTYHTVLSLFLISLSSTVSKSYLRSMAFVLFFYPFLYSMLWHKMKLKPQSFVMIAWVYVRHFPKAHSGIQWIIVFFAFPHLPQKHLSSQPISLSADANVPKGKVEPGLTSCQLTQELIQYTFPICHFPRHRTLKKTQETYPSNDNWELNHEILTVSAGMSYQRWLWTL